MCKTTKRTPVTIDANKMTNASLPALPSIRAKELERAASAINNESGDASAARSSSSSSAPSSESRGRMKTPQDSPRNYHSAIRGPGAHLTTEASSRDEYDRRRSEQLEAMHRKERLAFGGLPPLESSVACDAIHHYLVTTCSFLNSFIADVNAADEGIDHKLTVLEKQVALLESKVSSVPGLFPEKGNDDGNECMR